MTGRASCDSAKSLLVEVLRWEDLFANAQSAMVGEKDY